MVMKIKGDMKKIVIQNLKKILRNMKMRLHKLKKTNHQEDILKMIKQMMNFLVSMIIIPTRKKIMKNTEDMKKVILMKNHQWFSMEV